jgi:hypothetical protein
VQDRARSRINGSEWQSYVATMVLEMRRVLWLMRRARWLWLGEQGKDRLGACSLTSHLGPAIWLRSLFHAFTLNTFTVLSDVQVDTREDDIPPQSRMRHSFSKTSSIWQVLVT